MGPSIEETLENALKRLLQEDIVLQAASRTDTGVHAIGQVVTFKTTKPPSPEKLRKALCGILPKSISVKELHEVPSTFHPTLHCSGKEYHYSLSSAPVMCPFDRAYSWHFVVPLDIYRMEQAAQFLIGTHDFAAFCNMRHGLPSETVRTIHSIDFIQLKPNHLKIIIKGRSFLYKMVRNLVGTLVYTGCHKIEVASIPLIINGKDRTRAGVTAPAHGLTLYKVFY